MSRWGCNDRAMNRRAILRVLRDTRGSTFDVSASLFIGLTVGVLLK